jgi:hypothetical protein
VLLVAFFIGEMPDAYHALISSEVVGPLGESYAPLVVVCAFSLFFAVRPYFLHRIVFNTSPFYYFSVNMIFYFFVLSAAVIFVD